MKTLLTLVTLFLLVMLVGCGNQLEDEALKHAREYWKLTQLDGANYLCETSAFTKSPVSGVETRASKIVFELRNTKFVVYPSSLTEADKLNGEEWGGVVRLEADAFRRYSPQPSSGESDKTWSDWIPGKEGPHMGFGVGVRKVKGEWKVVPSPCLYRELYGWAGQPANSTFKQVEPSDLPE